MAPPNNPQVARVTYQMHRGTRTFENTFHVARTGGYTLAQLAAVVDAAYTLWNTYAKPAMPAGVALYNVHGVVYDPTGNPWVYDHPVSPEVAGTIAGNMAPGNASVTISERANLAGRKYRGRLYWPALPAANVNQDDTINSALIALLANFASNFLATYISATGVGQLAIFHRNTNLWSGVASIVLESFLDSMRRRLPGRGI